MPDYSSFILLQSFIFTGSDVTESIYFNVAMGWQVPIHRSPIVSLHLNIYIYSKTPLNTAPSPQILCHHYFPCFYSNAVKPSNTGHPNTVPSKVFLCGKLGKPASLQAIFSIFYGSEENTKTEDFFGRGGGGVGGRRIKLYTDNIKYYSTIVI